MIEAFKELEVWFVTGAQLLYGGETVTNDSMEYASHLFPQL